MTRPARTPRPPGLLLWAAVLVGGGCQPGDVAEGARVEADFSQTPGVKDDAGRRHPTAPARTRIVSLVPGMTETVIALGATERLVGRTRYDDQPELAEIPSVGGGLDPSLEHLAQLSPDLVIAWRDAGGLGTLSGRLEAVGLPVFQVEIESTADFRRHAANLGHLLDLSASASALIGELDRSLAAVRDAVEGTVAPTVLFLAQRDPPMAAGAGTFIDSLLVAAGGVNVLDVSGPAGDWPLISLEHILWRDPDFLVVPVEGIGEARDAREGAPPEVEELLRAPGWREIDAVAHRRVIAVDAGLFARPGPRMALAAASLAARLHPHVRLPAALLPGGGASTRGLETPPTGDEAKAPPGL
ncbi:MAG: helical backbone metal receptor [Gemmatimonadota bacterium]|nr:helical backbone metal receptor [Gemmatimonadota bacterium]